MSFLYKILGALAVVSLAALPILLRKRISTSIQRRKLARLRRKADRIIAGKSRVSEEKNEDIVNAFFQLYETSVYISKEDRDRIEKLNQLRI